MVAAAHVYWSASGLQGAGQLGARRARRRGCRRCRRRPPPPVGAAGRCRARRGAAGRPAGCRRPSGTAAAGMPPVACRRGTPPPPGRPRRRRSRRTPTVTVRPSAGRRCGPRRPWRSTPPRARPARRAIAARQRHGPAGAADVVGGQHADDADDRARRRPAAAARRSSRRAPEQLHRPPAGDGDRRRPGRCGRTSRPAGATA